MSVAVGGAGEVVSGLAELDGHLAGGGLEAVAELEVRVPPGGLGSFHLERVVVVALVFTLILKLLIFILILTLLIFILILSSYQKNSKKLPQMKGLQNMDSPWDGASCGARRARPCPSWRAS